MICALLFGERYDHEDENFEHLRKYVNESFKMLEENLDIDFIPFLRHFPHYKKKLGE